MDEQNKIKRFPIYPSEYVFNPLKTSFNKFDLKLQEIEISYPCRLDAMAIDPSAVAYNEQMLFTPGEVVISINHFIKTKIRIISPTGGVFNISKETKRKVLVKRAYHLITHALGVYPSIEISVDDNDVPQHCGFGSSSATISSVAVALNELYGLPIKTKELIRYLAANHGEEISKQDENNLKAVQSIGGGASSGMLPYGIILIAGRATPIATMNLNAEVLVAIPNDFEQKNADELMKMEEDNLWKFEKTGNTYKDRIAYNLLHKALPNMVDNNILELSKVVFDYRFNMGSIENCSFVYPKMIQIAKELRILFEKNHTLMLSLSSVGPAFFAIVDNDKDKEICTQKMSALNMKVYNYTIFNSKYIINGAKDARYEKRFLGKSSNYQRI